MKNIYIILVVILLIKLLEKYITENDITITNFSLRLQTITKTIIMLSSLNFLIQTFQNSTIIIDVALYSSKLRKI